MSTGRAPFRLMSLMFVLALLLAACGGGNAAGEEGLATLEEPSQSGDAATTTTAATTEADVEEAALAFSQCMRDEGVTDFPDPDFSAGGGAIALGELSEDAGIDFRSEEVQAAFETCSPLMEGIAFGPGGDDSFDPTEVQNNLLAMAQCLRDQGLAANDPALSNFGPAHGAESPNEGASAGADQADGGGGGLFGLDMADPAVQAAMEKCQAEVGFVRDEGGAHNAGATTEDAGQ